ncbi:MAG: uracil-DNA glycosylase [Clostridia bacterium]|nr:uracil-DNA glycosylase [Clostridia bacterium]
MGIIGNDWDEQLKEEFQKPYYKQIEQKVLEERAKYKVYPTEEMVFSALKFVGFADVKVVILGQDPYHEEGQANGMAFAVGDGTAYPPSLVNIFKEIESDIGVKPNNSGTLLGWAKQGVLLLNTVLTVRQGQALSHSDFGWQNFTDAIITALNGHDPVVYVLWGSNAIAKSKIIDKKHFVITSPHPSPLSAYRGFFGSKPFSKANEMLIRLGKQPIDWVNTDGKPLASYYKTSATIRKA